MKRLGVADAFGNPWAHSFRGWLALLVPSTVVVVLQETQTPFPHFGLVLLSALLQHCCAALAALPLIAVIRRRTEVIPVWAAIMNWTTGAVARAVAGSAMVAWFTDVELDFAFRVSSWLLVAWTWMPLLSYAVAQLEHRQRLIAARSEALRRRDEARERRELTAEQIRSQLVSDVSAATTTVIAEIESALDASRHQLNAHRLELVGHRLADVSAQARTTVERLSEEGEDNSRSYATPAAAPMVAALNFKREHPWRWSTLSAVALAGVTLPIAFETGGFSLLAELVIALTVIAIVLGTTSRLGSWGRATTSKKAVAWSAVRHAIAGVAGACVLGALRWSEMDTFAIVLLVVLPYAAAVAAETLSTAVGVAEANKEVLRSIDEVTAERRLLESTALENENRIRKELYDVMHGPILGRLSSCAMALNFLATEAGTVSSERITTVTSAVLDHLGETMQDLRLLKT